MIVLDGSSSGTSASGLILSLGSDGSSVNGLAIGNFASFGLSLQSDDNQIRCSQIGVGADGVSDIGNGSYGITVSGDGNIIGGPNSHARRNVISGNGSGFNISGANNQISNNFIGTTADGLSPLGNITGIFLSGISNNNLIGGTAPLARNVIGDHIGFGIVISGESNNVLGNYIGVGRDGIIPLPNNGGISLEGDANRIGGTGAGEANLIYNNAFLGIRVAGSGPPVQNEIRGNAIFGSISQGIDLGGDGVDINDPGDGDSGENERQNHPVLAATPGSYLVQGTLNSQPGTTYNVDVYRSEMCDPTGYGEGQQYLATVSATTNGSGQAVFQVDLAGLVANGNVVTATATDPLGNTSEFSACVIVSAIATATPTLTPTNLPPTLSPTSTWTATSGPSPTLTYTPTSGPSPTLPSSPTSGPSPTPTGTATLGPSPTPTLTTTLRPSPTPTATGSLEPEPTATSTPGANWAYLPLLIK
jgi:hypothetical protein